MSIDQTVEIARLNDLNKKLVTAARQFLIASDDPLIYGDSDEFRNKLVDAIEEAEKERS